MNSECEKKEYNLVWRENADQPQAKFYLVTLLPALAAVAATHPPLDLAENSSQYDGSENSPLQFHGKFETLTVSVASASSPGGSTIAGSPTPGGSTVRGSPSPGSMGQMAEYTPQKDVPPLTPLSINDPIFEDIIDSPPAPMMIASAAAVLYDYLEPEHGIKKEAGESEDGISRK